MTGKPGEIFEDDPTILPDIKVLRRVPTNPNHLNETNGVVRPASSNFGLDREGNGTSVTLWFSEDDLQVTRQGHDNFAIASIEVRKIREQGLGVVRRPIEAGINIAANNNHAEIVGKRTSKIQRNLAKACEWVIHPAILRDENQ